MLPRKLNEFVVYVLVANPVSENVDTSAQQPFPILELE